MRKLIIGVLAALLLVGGAGAASASHDPDEGPAPKNTHGHCTAYFNGQKTGHNKDGRPSPGPFADLEERGTEYDETHGENDEDLVDEQQVSDDVFEYCNDAGINPKGIGGNPEHNGRFDCRETDEKDGAPRDSDDDLEIECVPNGTETN